MKRGLTEGREENEEKPVGGRVKRGAPAPGRMRRERFGFQSGTGLPKSKMLPRIRERLE